MHLENDLDPSSGLDGNDVFVRRDGHMLVPMLGLREHLQNSPHGLTRPPMTDFWVGFYRGGLGLQLGTKSESELGPDQEILGGWLRGPTSPDVTRLAPN
jgi:hypothetical protein